MAADDMEADPKKLLAGATVVFGDEGGFRLTPSIAKAWVPAGMPAVLVHAFGAWPKGSVIRGVAVRLRNGRLESAMYFRLLLRKAAENGDMADYLRQLAKAPPRPRPRRGGQRQAASRTGLAVLLRDAGEIRGRPSAPLLPRAESRRGRLELGEGEGPREPVRGGRRGPAPSGPQLPSTDAASAGAPRRYPSRLGASLGNVTQFLRRRLVHAALRSRG